MKKNSDKKIALFAGALSLPFLVRDALRKNGWEVYVIGLKNFYDEKLNPDLVIRLGNGGRAARECKKRGIRKLVFAGALGHVNLSDIRPDFWSISVLLSGEDISSLSPTLLSISETLIPANPVTLSKMN